MRIHYRSIRRAESLRKRLQALLLEKGIEVSLTTSGDTLAKMIGYADWAELKKNIETPPPSPLDEACDVEEAEARRAYQVDALMGRHPDLGRDDAGLLMAGLAPSGRQTPWIPAFEETFERSDPGLTEPKIQPFGPLMSGILEKARGMPGDRLLTGEGSAPRNVDEKPIAWLPIEGPSIVLTIDGHERGGFREPRNQQESLALACIAARHSHVFEQINHAWNRDPSPRGRRWATAGHYVKNATRPSWHAGDEYFEHKHHQGRPRHQTDPERIVVLPQRPDRDSRRMCAEFP